MWQTERESRKVKELDEVLPGKNDELDFPESISIFSSAQHAYRSVITEWRLITRSLRLAAVFTGNKESELKLLE